MSQKMAGFLFSFSTFSTGPVKQNQREVHTSDIVYRNFL
mgnify:CR=1 FL=1